MAYSRPSTKTSTSVITGAQWNADIVTNMTAMAPDVFTAKGQTWIGTGADAGANLTPGDDDDILYVDTGETTKYNTGAGGRLWMIAETELTAATNDIVLTNIPQTFRNLRIIGSYKGDYAVIGTRTVVVWINDDGVLSDQSDKYFSQDSYGHATTVTSTENDTDKNYLSGLRMGDSTETALWSTFDITIYDYANTSANKVAVGICGAVADTSGTKMDACQVMWGYENLDAITSVRFHTYAESDFLAGTLITLYGER